MTSTIENDVHDLEMGWTLIFPTVPGPDSRQWAVWIMTQGVDIVRRAIAKLGGRFGRAPVELDNTESLIKFGSAIMNRLSREASATNNLTTRTNASASCTVQNRRLHQQ